MCSHARFHPSMALGWPLWGRAWECSPGLALGAQGSRVRPAPPSTVSNNSKRHSNAEL